MRPRTVLIAVGLVAAMIVAYEVLRLNYMGAASWTAANLAVRSDPGVTREIGPVMGVVVRRWKYYRCGGSMCAWTLMDLTGATGSGTAALALDDKEGGLWIVRAGCFSSLGHQATPIEAKERRGCAEIATEPAESAALPVHSWRDLLHPY
jgi:hypothetical protein